MNAGMQAIAGTDVFRLFASSVSLVKVVSPSRQVIDDALCAVARDGAPPADGARWESADGLERRQALAPLMDLFKDEARGVLANRHVQHGDLDVVFAAVESGGAGRERAFRSVANAYLAGLYVVETPRGGCSLEFEDPRAQAAVLTPPGNAVDAPWATTARLAMQVGHLAIFPAYLRHRVAPAVNDGRYLILRLGLMFSAFTRTMAAPLWQGSTR